MKTKVRKGAIAASLACVALSSALCLTTGQYTAAAEEAIAVPERNLAVCERTLTTIDKDVMSLVDAYNDVYENAAWAATEIEYSSPVFLIEDNKYGMYLDFDADNGYAVITTDKKIYGLETSGDLEYLRNGKEIYYSYIDGFMFVDNNKQLQKYESENNIEDDVYDGAQARQVNNTGTDITISYGDSSISINRAPTANDMTVYPGQTEAGDGEITPSKIDDYVSSRYPNFTLDTRDNYNASRFEYAHQFATSYYVQEYDTVTYSEGNCSLNAMYNVMRDWGKRGLIKIPYSQTEDIRSSILNDRLYATYGKGTKTGKDSNGTYKWVANSDSRLSVMPTLYSNIRSYALNNGYTPVNGYNRSKVPATMEYVANFLYNNNLDVEHTTNVSTVTNSIWLNRVCYLSINGSSTYGNHGVAVVGYHKYSKETKINNSYSIMEYKYFYEIADGWNYSSRIFDPNTSAKPQLNFYYLARC